MDRITTGKLGENMAAEMLKADGYRIVERNFSCRYGEIDIICEKEDTICFVEVKTRNTLEFGMPCEAVTKPKLNRIKKAAKEYIMQTGQIPEIQFMVTEIYVNTIKGIV